MNEKRLIQSIEDITSKYSDKGLSVDVRTPPRVPINTDNTGMCHPDWSLYYWIKPRSPYEVFNFCLNPEDLNKVLKFIRFSPLEMLVRDTLNKIRQDFKIKHISSEIIQDPEDQEERLLVEIYIDEKDPKQVIEQWKKISTSIRNEIDNKFRDKSKEYQLKLQISVKPSL